MNRMPTQATVVRPADLKPMPYGSRTNFRSIKDGIWEPLWGGRRVMIDALDDPRSRSATNGREAHRGL